MYGFSSPKLWRSKAIQAVPASNGLACTHDTHSPFGRPRMLATTLVHCLPPSRVTCRLPSSVPTQIRPARFGDSLIEKIVSCISAYELSTVTPPDSSCFCCSGLLVVRSGEMRCQVLPWSLDLNRNCAPM